MPKTKEQFNAIREERQKLILSAALYLFATRGYDATSTDAIAAAVNCSHGLIYHYYPTKESLIQAVFEKEVQPIADIIFKDININQKAKFVMTDLIEAILSALKNDNDEYVWALQLLLNLRLNSIVNPLIKHIDLNKKINDRFLEIIERGIQEGDFKDKNVKELAAVLIALFKGLTHNRLKIGYKKFICPHSDIIMSMLLK